MAKLTINDAVFNTLMFEKGNKVKFVDEVGEATVIGFSAGMVMLLDEFGFEFLCHPDKLLLAHSKDFEIDFMSPDVCQKIASDTAPRKAKKTKTKPTVSEEIWEIDLHAHEIMADSRSRTNHEIVQRQLSYFKSMLTKIISAKFRKAIFIHGVGEGVLKEEIRSHLGAVENCTYADADYSRYGIGATEVTLWYK